MTGLCIGLAYALLIRTPLSSENEPTYLFGSFEWRVLVLTFSGILGGVIYTIMVDGHIEMPRYVEGKGALFEAGLFGDILLGIAGAFILQLLLPAEWSVMSDTAADLEAAGSQVLGGSAIAATGIVGGYGGRALIQFSLERFFKYTGTLDEVRASSILRRRAAIEAREAELATGEVIDGSVVSGLDQVQTEVLIQDLTQDAAQNGTITGTAASADVIALIEAVDRYIQVDIPESDWQAIGQKLSQQLRKVSLSVRQEVFAAIVDLRQAGGSAFDQPGDRLSNQPGTSELGISRSSISEPVTREPVTDKSGTDKSVATELAEELTIELTEAQLRRTAIVLEALSQLDSDNHEIDYQLGLVYKDIAEDGLDPGDNKLLKDKAIGTFSRAIARRGPLAIGGPWQYELARALVNIQAGISGAQGSADDATSSALEDSADLAGVGQSAILSDLLAIARIYNLETFLKAAKTQKIPTLVIGWLRRNRTLLEQQVETRSLIASLDPILVPPHLPPPARQQDSIPDNPQGIRFPLIYSTLGQCYDILHLDPFDLIGSAKKARIFHFYPGEAQPVLDEGNPFWIPKNTRYLPGSKGSLSASTQTDILRTEADIQKLFSTTLGGTLGSAVAKLAGVILPFSLSASYGKFKQERKAQKSVYAFTKAEYVHYALDLLLGPVETLHLDLAFRQSVARLPLNAATYAYLDFIDSFGTHFSTQVKFGGRVHHRLRLLHSTYSSVIRRGIDVATEAKKVFQAKYTNDSQGGTYHEIAESSETLDFCGGIAQENIHDWFNTIKADPAPIHVDLLPLYDLLNTTFFPQDSQIARKRSLLAAATETYLERNSQPAAWEPWSSVAVGGSGGSPFSDIDLASSLQAVNQARYQQAQVSAVKVWIKNWIECVQIVLDEQTVPPPALLSAHGSEDGELAILHIDPGDYITGVEVMSASPQKLIVERGPYVGSLRLYTHRGKVWTVGTPDDEPVTLDIPDGHQVVGFHGRLGRYIDQLGVISMPVAPRRNASYRTVEPPVESP